MKPTEILLVEDSAGDAMLLADALEMSGWAHHMTRLADGDTAVAYLLQEGGHAGATRPDLVILDVNLPTRNGFEVLGAIRGAPAVAKLPVFMLSGSEQERGLPSAAGATELPYFRKPMTFKGYLELAGRMEALFRTVEA